MDELPSSITVLIGHRPQLEDWMKRFFGLVMGLTTLASCRDYDFHSRLTDQDGLIPADQFARYGREQADAMAIGREFGADLKAGSTDDPAKQPSGYARTLPEVADVQADPLGYRLTLRFKSGWRTAVNPIQDGKRGAQTVGQPAGAGRKTAP
jgi:hypothetical protein